MGVGWIGRGWGTLWVLALTSKHHYLVIGLLSEPREGKLEGGGGVLVPDVPRRSGEDALTPSVGKVGREGDCYRRQPPLYFLSHAQVLGNYPPPSSPQRSGQGDHNHLPELGGWGGG